MRIAIYAFDGITMFHLSVPQMVFDEVTRLGARRLGDRRLLRPARFGPDRRGLTLGPVQGLAAAADADLVVVPSWTDDGTRLPTPTERAVVEAHARGSVVVGLCLGSIAVAGAGLLAGRSAVTHWREVDRLAAAHPDVTVDPDVLYVDHGDVLTSAGTASGLDACLHVVRTRLGAEAANRVARSLVVAPHREGGQAQYIERPVVQRRDDDPVATASAWAVEHLDEEARRRPTRCGGPHEPPQLRPGLQGVDRHHPRGLGTESPSGRGPSTARDHRPARRPDRRSVRVRQPGHAAAELRRGVRQHTLELPPTVRRAALTSRPGECVPSHDGCDGNWKRAYLVRTTDRVRPIRPGAPGAALRRRGR